jgi:hypothetical protein
MMQISEYEYLDGAHGTETMSYLVVERGAHTLSDGSNVEAGSFEGLQDDFTFVPFTSEFSSTPVVLA